MAQREVHYHCPSCGAPQSEAGRGACDYCGAPRVPIGTPDPSTAIRCSGCHALVASGSSFCPGCGHAMAQFDSTRTDLSCPHCKDEAPQMTRWGIAPSSARREGFEIDGCTHCGGVWVQQSTLSAMMDEASRIAAHREVDERQVKRRVVTESTDKVEYRRCPACTQLMARQNFQRVSGIILDSCLDHGTFFDAGELEDTLDFVRSGGLLMAQRHRAVESERVERAERASKLPAHRTGSLGADRRARAMLVGLDSRSPLELTLGEVTLSFLRWSAGWTWRMGRRVWRGLRS